MRESTIDQAADRLLETPDFERAGSTVSSPEGALRGMNVEQVEPNIVVFFSEKATIKPAGWIMMYFMDTPAAAAEMKAGKIAYPVFMPGSLSMRFGGYSMIDALWKRPKKQRWWKPGDAESEAKKIHVVGALEAYKGNKEIFVDNLSVRPGWRKNTIGSKLMQALKNHFPGLPVTHSQPTDQGRKFLKKTGDYQQDRDNHAGITGPVTTESPTDEALISSIILTLLEKDEDSDEAWIGVDFDGTLAKHTTWKGNKHCGKPIPKMVARVRRWVGHGKKVRIFTARADDEEAVNAIKKWLKDNELPDLPITNLKDHHMTEFWDDKAVAVVKNTGEVKESKNPPFVIEDFLLEADEAWEPSPHVIAWFQNLLRGMAHNGTWVVPATGQVYQFDKPHHAVTLVHGEPNDPEGWHNKTKLVLQQLGYTVHDNSEPQNPDEQMFAEAEQPSDYEEWEPDPRVVNSIQHALMQMHILGRRVLEVGETGHAYKIDFDNGQAALIEGSPKDPQHDNMKKILTLLGFTVHDYPPVPPSSDELSFSESRLVESPTIEKLKKHRCPLSPQEKSQIPKNLPAGDGATVLKAEVDGQTWYACYTHRAGQVRKTFKELLKVYPKIASTA